jgi:hypothetical protein
MNLDGTGLGNVIENVSNLADALELDAVTDTLYFTTGTFDANTAKVERVAVNGTGRQALANAYAYSLFLDHIDNRILGSDWDRGVIFEMRPDQFIPNDLFSAPASRDVQRYGDHLIYSDISVTNISGNRFIFSRIVRSDLDGSNQVVLREINRQFQPADPIAFFIFVPEPSSILGVVMTLGLMLVRWPRRNMNFCR